MMSTASAHKPSLFIFLATLMPFWAGAADDFWFALGLDGRMVGSRAGARTAGDDDDSADDGDGCSCVTGIGDGITFCSKSKVKR